VKAFCEDHPQGRIEADTAVSRRSYDVALLAAGTAIAAVEAVVQGDDQTALCLVRPPGHHALPASAMGFCLFNNIGLAAEHALKACRLNRVLIVDWDVHHGNGTQDMFYERDDVWFFSAHRFPFYPGTGAADETGTGKGLGATFNLPVKFGTPRKDYYLPILPDVTLRGPLPLPAWPKGQYNPDTLTPMLKNRLKAVIGKLVDDNLTGALPWLLKILAIPGVVDTVADGIVGDFKKDLKDAGLL
jgi:hypothetical protein